MFIETPINKTEEFSFSYIFPNNGFYSFLSFENLEGKKLYVVLICISLILRNVDYSFLVYWPICVLAGLLTDLKEIFVYEDEVAAK